MKQLDEFLAELDAAITTASGRLGLMRLRVETVDVTFKTEFVRKVGGGLDLKIFSADADVGTGHGNEVSVSFKPRGVVPAAALEDELIDGIELIEDTVRGLHDRFSLDGASVELAFLTTKEGKVKLFIKGEGSRADSHVAKLNLKPTD